MSPTPPGDAPGREAGAPPSRAAAFAAIALLTVACFAPALGNTLFVWDDDGYILQNAHIRSLSLQTVAWAFTEYCCNYWAPLTWLSLALDYAVWGLNPVGYHLTNVLLHALNAGLFFLLSRELISGRLARGREPDQGAPGREHFAFWSAGLAALIFALHPLRVESVAWAAERKDVLSLFFGILATLAYLRHAASRPSRPGATGRRAGSFLGSPHYWLAFASFCLSLLGKPMLVTFPLVLLVLDWFPLERIRRSELAGLLAEKVTFLLVSVSVTLISMDAQRPQTMPLAQSGPASRVLNAFKSVANYLWLTLWPVDISPFYLHPGNITRISPEYVWSVAVVGLVTAACLLLVKRQRLPLAAWLVYLSTLIPVLGFTQVGPQAMAARFTYLPSLPVALALALAIATAIATLPRPWLPALLRSATVLWLLGLSLCTVQHISFWKDDVTLWTRVIDLSPHFSGRAYFQRSLGHARKGEPELALADVDEALAIATRKKYQSLHEIYQARARVLMSLGRPREAVADYTAALESAGRDDKPMILLERGAAHRQLGEEALAVEDLEAVTGRH